jgi:hypothetical protein
MEPHTVSAMNDLLNALKGILGQVFMNGFGTTGFYVTSGVTVLVLYFACGWILKTIFSHQKGYVRPFFVILATLAIAVIFAAICRTWVSPGISNSTLNTAVLCIFAGVGAAIGIVLSNILLKIKFVALVAFNIVIIVVAFAVIFCFSTAYNAIADAASSLEHKQPQIQNPLQ